MRGKKISRRDVLRIVRVPTHAARDRGLNAAVDLFLGIAGNAFHAGCDRHSEFPFPAARV